MNIIETPGPPPKGKHVRSTSVFHEAEGAEEWHHHLHAFHKNEALAQQYLDRYARLGPNKSRPGNLVRQYITHRDERGRFAAASHE
jgi:hypothetical protein